MTQQNPAIEVAFISMEIMLESDIPTYAGGLGVLAGDMLHSMADMGVPGVGVSLVYSGDTFSQNISLTGSQFFKRTDWQKLDQLTKLPTKIEIEVAGQKVIVGCWRYDFVGYSGHHVPVYLLDTNMLENPPWVRDFTTNLYSSNGNIRICQELVLGIGSVKMLAALGYNKIGKYHLNEGHAAFTTLQLLAESGFKDDEVRKRCIFTTHTPVPEGHDKFDWGKAYHYAGKYLPWHIKKLASEECLNMTRLATSLSGKNFAVSRKHKQVSDAIIPGVTFDYVTNGVHNHNWTAPTIQNMFDRFVPGWYENPIELARVPQTIPDDIFWQYHQDAKSKLVRYVNTHLTSVTSLTEKNDPLKTELFDDDVLTISLARRPVAYKRPLLLYQDLARFVRIGAGRLQIIQCGKSHPDDNISQEIVREIVTYSKKFKDILKIVYLEDYSPKIARMLVSGSDIWLNTPKKPLEASGTSGMKAAFNGVLNFSVLDGWWIEAFEQNPQAGFSIGRLEGGTTPVDTDEEDANDLYDKLEHQIIPLYYSNRTSWIARMKQAVTLASYYNTHRVVADYRGKGWKN